MNLTVNKNDYYDVLYIILLGFKLVIYVIIRVQITGKNKKSSNFNQIINGGVRTI